MKYSPFTLTAITQSNSLPVQCPKISRSLPPKYTLRIYLTKVIYNMFENKLQEKRIQYIIEKMDIIKIPE